MAHLESLASLIADANLSATDYFLYVTTDEPATVVGDFINVAEVSSSTAGVAKVAGEAAVLISKSAGGYFEYENVGASDLNLYKMYIRSGWDGSEIMNAPLDDVTDFITLAPGEILRFTEIKLEFS